MSITNLINKAKASLTNLEENTTMTNEFDIENGLVTIESPVIAEVVGETEMFGFDEDQVVPTNVEEEGDLKLANLLNVSALASTVIASLYHQFNEAQLSTLVGCAIVDAIELSDNMGMPEAFFGMVESTMESSVVRTQIPFTENFEGDIGEGSVVDLDRPSAVTYDIDYDIDAVFEAMLACDYVNSDFTIGAKLIELMEQRKEAYAPLKVGQDWERRFPLYAKEKGQCGNLAIEAIEALESTPFTVDEGMLIIANQVQAKMGGKRDDEAYVLSGCNAMSSKQAYFSEFNADARIRLYQAACHGPNGQASDRSRALMDLHGVPTDYNIEVVKQAIRAEILDMVSIPASEVGKLMRKAITNPVDFIMGEEAKPKSQRDAGKPWSFVKAAIIWNQLALGNRPYIGMAVGLDAKCSGPQLGALMSGDAEVAAACGFTLKKMEDAYHRAIRSLIEAGFEFNMSHRNLIKKPFMGIFYGQGWAAFTDIKQLVKDEQQELIEILYGDREPSEEVAKLFHKAISKSFGKKMQAVRSRFREFEGRIEGRITHMMPDSSKVAMNYKVKVNIRNEQLDFGISCPDVVVSTENNTYKFNQMSLKTKLVHEGDFVRNGFVNLIQGTDALIARLIIVHLKRLGAQHIISVHDCFRVNVTEVHLLEQAIKNAYRDLFGSRTNVKTVDLPLGTDILALYFEGASKSLLAGNEVTPIKQFMTVKGAGEVRKLGKIHNVPVVELIEALGTSYYFAK